MRLHSDRKGKKKQQNSERNYFFSLLVRSFVRSLVPFISDVQCAYEFLGSLALLFGHSVRLCMHIYIFAVAVDSRFPCRSHSVQMKWLIEAFEGIRSRIHFGIVFFFTTFFILYVSKSNAYLIRASNENSFSNAPMRFASRRKGPSTCTGKINCCQVK